SLGRSAALARRATAAVPAPGLGAGKLAVVLALGGAAAAPTLVALGSPPDRPARSSGAVAAHMSGASSARSARTLARSAPSTRGALAPARSVGTAPAG